jgi:hypothetical protein
MRRLVVALLGISTIGLAASTTAQAQGPGGARRYSSPYGNYGAGGVSTPPARGRQLRRNQSPTLSPYLNLVPDTVNTFEGQYLLRAVPQQEFTRQQEQTQRALDNIQGQVNTQRMQITSGLSTTGHSTSFMNLGSFYGGR